MNHLAHAARRFHDHEPNPVLVKEVRQAVRSNHCMITLVMVLLALTLFSLVIMVQAADAPTAVQRAAGSGQLGMVIAVLVIALLATALSQLMRSHGRREGGGDDLMRITTLTPGAIVRGRVLASLCSSALVLSAGLPYLAVTYLLRGVSITAILGAFAGLAVLAVVLAFWMTHLSVSTTPERSRLVLVGSVFLPMMTLPGFLMAAFRGGLGGGGVSQVEALTGVALVVVTLVLALYAAAVYALTPASANRSRSCRLWHSGLLLAWWVLTPLLVMVFGDAAWAHLALVMGCILIVGGGLTGVQSSGPLSRRVLQELPRQGWRRCLALPFANGTLPILLWTALMWLALILWDFQPLLLESTGIGRLGGRFTVPVTEPTYVSPVALLMAAGYCLLYLMLAFGLGAWLERRMATRKPGLRLGLLAVITTVGVVGPHLAGLLIVGTFSNDSFATLGSILSAFSETQVDSYGPAHLIFIGGLMAMMLFVTNDWLRQARRECRPPDTAPPPRPAPPVAVPVPPPLGPALAAAATEPAAAPSPPATVAAAAPSDPAAEAPP
ncbi:MAG: hypothetical protein GX595_18060 [Lentisphaerae bacterium]|nr:hypothetical protein [Lentisphaerota bacterium]